MRRSRAGIAAAALLLCLVTAATAAAADHYALVITGASGGEVYAQKYDRWRVSFVATLREKFGYPEDHVIVLAEMESGGVARATRENVQRALGDLRRRLTADDQLLVVLMGHGTALENDDGKFNLVGPDLRASEWADLVKPIAARLVFVDTSSASVAFLHQLAGRGRIVLTATDAAAQQFETVFPEFFLKAFDDPMADVDKNGRVSVWEAFVYASAGVRQWFEQHGHLPTERPLLDDTGAGVGREAQNPGADGVLARTTYLEPDAALAGGDAALAALLKRQRDLEAALEALKARKASTPPDQYEVELEKLLVELAKISRQIRIKS